MLWSLVTVRVSRRYIRTFEAKVAEKLFCYARTLDLVVTVRYSLCRGHEFASQLRMLDGSLFTLTCCTIF